MPVKDLSRQRSKDYSTLVAELAAEWRQPNSTNIEPIILTERGRDGKVEHVYVIWSQWADIDRQQRSEVIMDAAEKVLTPEEILNITIAMGLTADEADRMGIKG